MGSGSSSRTCGSFALGPKIGEGSYGIIRRATHISTKKLFAIKIISIDNCISRTGGTVVLKQEILSLKKLSFNGFICNLYYSYHDNKNCALILDLLEGGDLRYHLNDCIEFTEFDVAFIGACMVSALSHIHNHGIIHRDVKPENIVLDEQGYPRLTDFGISYNTSAGSVCSLCSGTVGYLAPEVLTQSHSHSMEVDFWALGVVMFELLFGARPFDKNCPASFTAFVESTYQHFPVDSPTVRDLSYSTYSTKTSIDEFSCSASDNQSTDMVDEGRKHVLNVPLPKHLVMRIPLMTYSGKKVSYNFVSIIRGFMDVRIPQRLGARSNREELQRHPFFSVFNWDDLLYKRIRSPLHVDVNVTRACLELKHFDERSTIRSSHSSFVARKLPAEIQNIINEYSYESPHYLNHLRKQNY